MSKYTLFSTSRVELDDGTAVVYELNLWGGRVLGLFIFPRDWDSYWGWEETDSCPTFHLGPIAVCWYSPGA